MKIAIIRGKYTNPYELQNYELLAKKNEVTVFTSKHPMDNNIPFKIESLLSPFDLSSFPYKIPILNRLLIEAHILLGLENRLQGYDIAYVAETYFGFTQQAINAKKHKKIKKIVCLCWEIIPFNNEGIHGRKQYKKNTFKYIDHFICPTELSKKALTAEGCDEKKISVIPLGVDLTKFKPSNSFTSQAIKLLFVGRLEVEKGIFDLLKSFIRLKKKVPKLVLTIIGAGSKKKMIYKFINHHNLLRFVTIKNISYSQIHTLYNTSDIFVLPSKPTKYWQEQYGMVLLEAMASGLPIVTTNTGAIPEVVGNAALLCKPGDVAELTQSIYKLICDESLRKDLSIKALERAVTRYDSRRTGKKIIKLMNKVLTS